MHAASQIRSRSGCSAIYIPQLRPISHTYTVRHERMRTGFSGLQYPRFCRLALLSNVSLPLSGCQYDRAGRIHRVLVPINVAMVT